MKPTHLDDAGRVVMVNVEEKASTVRKAVAEARIRMSPETMKAVRDGQSKKGDIAAVVRLAGIMGAKKTGDLIPLCHTVALDHVEIDLEFSGEHAVIRTVATATGRTGVEMEALTAAALGALTFYDMVKGMERGVVIESIRLLEKEGGRSGHWIAD